jgi:hypothetical protein
MERSNHMAVFWANGPHVGPCFLSGAASDGCPAMMQHGWKTNKQTKFISNGPMWVDKKVYVF